VASGFTRALDSVKVDNVARRFIPTKAEDSSWSRPRKDRSSFAGKGRREKRCGWPVFLLPGWPVRILGGYISGGSVAVPDLDSGDRLPGPSPGPWRSDDEDRGDGVVQDMFSANGGRRRRASSSALSTLGDGGAVGR
jgi:hypothetical protein